MATAVRPAVTERRFVEPAQSGAPLGVLAPDTSNTSTDAFAARSEREASTQAITFPPISATLPSACWTAASLDVLREVRAASPERVGQRETTSAYPDVSPSSLTSIESSASVTTLPEVTAAPAAAEVSESVITLPEVPAAVAEPILRAVSPPSPLSRKQLTPFTVTLDERTGRWSAFVSMPKLSPADARRPAQGQVLGTNYRDRHSALRACEAFAPPIWQPKERDDFCDACSAKFGLTRSRHHCRNCGKLVCASKTCSEQWPAAALPSTYVDSDDRKLVHVCQVCVRANVKFRDSLRRGDVLAAMEAYSTGCVNLRTPNAWCADWAYPVHCAAAGGSLEALIWMVEERSVPLCFAAADGSRVPVLMRDRRSVLAVAASYNRMDVVRYLIREQACRAHEITTTADLCRIVETLVMEEANAKGPAPGGAAKSSAAAGGAGSRAGTASNSPATSPSTPDTFAPSAPPSSSWEPMGVMATAQPREDCIICMAAPIGCVFAPCGHQSTCARCGPLFAECPLCNAPIQQCINIFKVGAP